MYLAGGLYRRRWIVWLETLSHGNGLTLYNVVTLLEQQGSVRAYPCKHHLEPMATNNGEKVMILMMRLILWYVPWFLSPLWWQ